MQRPTTELAILRSIRLSCFSLLKDFKASASPFVVVKTISPSKPAAPPDENKRLFVLDASFNPPTRAHHEIAYSALSRQREKGYFTRLLLLLATTNADKADKPAALEDRLVMMILYADELLFDLQEKESFPSVDVCLVKEPLFHNKAAAIAASDIYSGRAEQVHLVGYDTLIRIFDTKYYPPDHSLRVLQPFLSKHCLRVTYRTDDKWGSRQEQDRYVQDIADGKRLADGAQREWARNISLVKAKGIDEDAISSTLARDSARTNSTQLDKLVMPSIRDWMVSEGLYLEEK
jgi:nicotinamide-nucleotide adenylyltransferase